MSGQRVTDSNSTFGIERRDSDIMYTPPRHPLPNLVLGPHGAQTRLMENSEIGSAFLTHSEKSDDGEASERI